MPNGVFLIACALVGGACAHQEPAIERTTAPAAWTPAKNSNDAAISDGALDDVAAQMACSALYEKAETCVMLRSMIEARTRVTNRACLAQLHFRAPGYHWLCWWQSFAKRHMDGEKIVGVGPDCYSDRFGAEGVQCSLEDNDHPTDRSAFFAATEAELRNCLDGWHYEKKEVTRSLGDRAFSFSKALDPASPAVVTRVQGCLGTAAVSDEATGAPTGDQSYMRFEVFTEPAR